ncbi:GDSL-type esterase/lipase family protein [Cochlodiniinecator piscidefendens]|uniref:GDSL-type esterase/lipase family protein n=1 Tax=Cochlodiniinecator piscidefendens TaxID=2715756 RepID=UPI00140BD832|nr:GDSL-type esterase/lipase family protein [Cochlodiniinecator piscidefendens]
MKKRVMVYGDSNSWGYLSDGLGIRCPDRWPVVMARLLNVELIEECLPGRTTVHDDPEFMGDIMNGLRHLPVALKSHSPLDTLIIMLGTNDLKSRFNPSAEKIAKNIGKLIDCAIKTGAGQSNWEDTTPPNIYVVVPPKLPEYVNDPQWERCEEWKGGYSASLSLFAAVQANTSSNAIPIFDAGSVIAGAVDDPIHWTQASHKILGETIANWIASLEKLRDK